MTNVVPISRPLGLALLADAAASGASAVLLVQGAGFLLHRCAILWIGRRRSRRDRLPESSD
jgi:hypothetical protein